MKSALFSTGLVLFASLCIAHPGLAADRSGPCVDVNVQNDTVNRSRVEQNCERNINRTVQAGKKNSAQTVQSGDVNNNKVRQYQYDRSRYLEKLRRKNN